MGHHHAMMPHRHVIWDWNGTLLDDTSLVVDVMNMLLAKRSMPMLTAERYRALFRFPVRDYYADVGFDFAREPFEVLADEWILAFEQRWRSASLHPGAIETIASVRDLGVGQSILSAAQQSALDEQAAHFGIAPLVERLAGIHDHHAESKLEQGRRLIHELRLDPAEVLMVGDTSHDYDVAADLGTSIVLVDYGHQSRSRLEALGVPVVASLAEIVAAGGPLRAPSTAAR